MEEMCTVTLNEQSTNWWPPVVVIVTATVVPDVAELLAACTKVMEALAGSANSNQRKKRSAKALTFIFIPITATA